MTQPFLITGCGRSGTGWAARFFTTMGHRCGHEEQYAPWVAGPLDRHESSWLAIPYLHTMPPGTRVLRVMRDPYHVVRSVIGRGFLKGPHGTYEGFVGEHSPVIARGGRDHLGRAILWTALWDAPLEDHPHEILRVADHSLNALATAYEYATRQQTTINDIKRAVTLVGGKVNANAPWYGRTGLPTNEQIDAHPLGYLIADRAQQFGYTESRG